MGRNRKREIEEIQENRNESLWINKELGKVVARAYWLIMDKMWHSILLDVPYEVTVEVRIEEHVIRMSSVDQDALIKKQGEVE